MKAGDRGGSSAAWADRLAQDHPPSIEYGCIIQAIAERVAIGLD